MKDKILEFINEQHSPLFRVMSVYNDDDSARKKFGNNISASHIGNGYVITVGHNLRIKADILHSLDETEYQNEFISNLDPREERLFNRCYQLDTGTNKRYLNTTNNNDISHMAKAINRINYDSRWVSLYSKGICKPFLIVQFTNGQFYNDPTLTGLFPNSHKFHEAKVGCHTFLVELELVEAFWSKDIAIYRIVSTDQRTIDRLPSAAISFELEDIGNSLYCLQGSPSGTNLGRMINESRIEGILDQHDYLRDTIGGDVIFTGNRYLLKGYFRFGSSGAPYLTYDTENETFVINAIQSQASPIQLSIKNSKEGNYQYVNAIATPLSLIQSELEKIMTN